MHYIVSCIAAVLLFGIYIFAEHYFIRVRRSTSNLRELPKSFDGMKVLHISDLHHRHFGKHQTRLTEKIRKENPDIIVITGDLVSRDERNFTETGIFCSSISSIAPVYLSLGNHELDLPDRVRDTYLETLRSAGVTVLRNETACITGDGDKLYIAGADLHTSVYHSDDFQYGKLNSYEHGELTKDLGVRKGCTLLLAHNPLIFDAYAQWKADAVFSGHVHGGAVRLPFIGGVLSPERRFFPKYSKGRYVKNGTVMQVSAGLGKLRFLNPPEICVVTLKK